MPTAGTTTGWTTGAPAEGEAPFVVPRVRRNVRRDIAINLVSLTLVVVMFVGRLVTDDSGWWIGFTGALLLMVAVSFGRQAVRWWRLMEVEELLVIGPTGVRVAVLGRGTVALPWEAVGVMRRDLWDRVVVKPAPGVGPSTPGTEWPADGPGWWTRRRGHVIPLGPSPYDVTQVMAAVRHFRPPAS